MGGKGLRTKLAQLQQENQAYMREIKELISSIKEKQGNNVVSYFTYSLNLSHDLQRENLSLGSYHIVNLGNQPITNPYICIKLSSESPLQFLGKYQSNNSKQIQKAPGAWERINDQTDKGEYWLKPTGKEKIGPNERVSFSNFQVKWLPKESYKGTIMGFTYGDEIKDGVPAVNQINVSGKVPERGDEGE